MAKCTVDYEYDEWYKPTLLCDACKCYWMELEDGDSIYCPHCGELLGRVKINV